MRRSILAGALSFLMGASAAMAEHPSPKRAFFMSLLVPGWGEYALGAHRRAAAFLSVESALWLGYGGLRTLRGIYEDDYRAFAASVAGANVEGKGRTYFDDLAFYDTRVHHNQVALVYDQPDPVLYGIEDDWQWPTTADRLRFRDRYNRAKLADRRLQYVLLGIALNHFASAVDAAKIASGRAKRTTIRAAPTPDGGVAVAVVVRF